MIPRHPEVPEAVARRMYIRKGDIEKFGETPGCLGCRRIALGKPLQSHTAVCRDRIEGLLRETEEGQQRLGRADDRVTEPIVRESERLLRTSGRDDAELNSRRAEPPSVVRESTVESAPGADEGSRPPPPRDNQQASMGRGGGSAETRRSHRGRKRAASGDLSDTDQREAISRRLPDAVVDRGHKRASSDNGGARMCFAGYLMTTQHHRDCRSRSAQMLQAQSRSQ